MSDKPHIFELFDPGKYIQAFELDGRDHTVTINRIVGEEVEGEEGRKAKKPVIYLAEFRRPLVLNKTNAKTLIALYGPDYRTWAGKRFVMYPTVVKFGRDDVDAIRLRKKVPPAAQQKPEPPAMSIAERIAAVKAELKVTNELVAIGALRKKASRLIADLANEPANLLDDLNLAFQGRENELEAK